jgi:outer membrane lipoprotein SlyB
MFNKFQERISKLLEDFAGNTIGGVFGDAAGEGGTFLTTPIKVDMAIAGGIKPTKKKKKKPFFPVAKRPIRRMAKSL